MSKKKKKKTPKEKVVYYDDNSTVSDMSCLDRSGRKRNGEPKRRSTFREKWKTYWQAVKRMLLPMFIVLAVLFFVYFLMMLISGNLF